jgi:hypothetical protein
MWTAKSVSAHIFTERISDEQCKLSNDGDKAIGKYRAALANVFNELTEAEVKRCEDLAAVMSPVSLYPCIFAFYSTQSTADGRSREGVTCH